jgi:hypothetical protein
MHLFFVHVVLTNWLPSKGTHKAMHLPKFLMEKGALCLPFIKLSWLANMLFVEEYMDHSPFLANNMRESFLIDHPRTYLRGL